MNTSKLILAASLLIAAPLTSSALEPLVTVANESEHNSLVWVNQYYKNPNPEILVKRVYVLSRIGYFEEEGQPAQSIGFFAAIFAKNPERVEGWLSKIGGLPERHQRILAAAAWQAGSPAGIAMLKRLQNKGSALAGEILASTPTSLSDVPVRSTASMNLQWGAFLASGDERHVTNILAAVGSKTPGISESARMTLALNAAQDDRVLDICRSQLDKQPNAVKEILRAAINEAETSKQPSRI